MSSLQFVTYKQAVSLKKVGFDWECNHEIHGGFDNTDYPFYHRHPHNFNGPEYSGLHTKWYSVPSLELAAKWLRDVRHIYINVDAYNRNGTDTKINGYECTVLEDDGRTVFHRREMQSYEEALATAIDSVISLLKPVETDDDEFVIVDFDQAVALANMGFPQDFNDTVYITISDSIVLTDDGNYEEHRTRGMLVYSPSGLAKDDRVSAPPLELAARWLRHAKDTVINVWRLDGGYDFDYNRYSVSISSEKNGERMTSFSYARTYDDALSLGLDIALGLKPGLKKEKTSDNGKA